MPKHSDREKTAYPIPNWLQLLVERRTEAPRVRIRRIEVDFGPATKLIPSVMEAQGYSNGEEEEAEKEEGGGSSSSSSSTKTKRKQTLNKKDGENVLILVVDDDTLYPPRLLETLLEWNRRLPDAALAFSGWPVIAKTLK